jgi:hypothetical protein
MPGTCSPPGGRSTVIGAGVVQMTVRPRSVGGGAVVLGVGVVLQLWRLEVIDDLSLLWPVLLLTLGGWLLLGHRSRPRRARCCSARLGEEVGGSEEDLDIVTVFSDRRSGSRRVLSEVGRS